MYTMRIDARGTYDIRWAQTDRDALEQAKKYLDFETGLPDAQRIAAPALTQIKDAYDQASAAVASASGAETSRAVSSTSYGQAYDQALPLLRKAITSLKGRYVDNLSVLEAWGLQTKQGRVDVSVLKPTTEKGWVSFLLKYVEKEGSLDPSARITVPSFEEIQPLANQIKQDLEAREQGRTQREMGVSTRSAAVEQLVDLLQVAAGVLIVSRYGFKVTRDLGQWGFEVVEHTSAPAATPGESAAGGQ